MNVGLDVPVHWVAMIFQGKELNGKMDVQFYTRLKTVTQMWRVDYATDGGVTTAVLVRQYFSDEQRK